MAMLFLRIVSDLFRQNVLLGKLMFFFILHSKYHLFSIVSNRFILMLFDISLSWTNKKLSVIGQVNSEMKDIITYYTHTDRQIGNLSI